MGEVADFEIVRPGVISGGGLTWMIYNEAADMPEWNKFPGPDSPAWTGEPSWLREKRAAEDKQRAIREMLIIFDQHEQNQFIRKHPNLTQRLITPLPEFLCLHFIGGPKNASQEFWNYRNNASIVFPEKVFEVRVEEPISPNISENGDVNLPKIEQFSYKAVFIPVDQTPFSDAQIVICVFQG